MALNWFLTLRNLTKSDAKAAELFELLQKAETDEEKENAKKQAQEYILQLSQNSSDKSSEDEVLPNTEETVVEEDKGSNNECDPVDSVDNPVSDNGIDVADNKETDEEKIKTDLSQLAFNPRLAKCGITREEELFLNHVFVRKMSHEDKILMRRSIYQKKTVRNAQIQAEFRAKRIAQREKDLNDPEKIKFHQERKLVSALVDALENHKNMRWIFSSIEDLTPEVVRDLLQKPENRNAINTANPAFIENFYKKYGK